MTFSLRHIFLLTGIAAVIISFLFFGRQQNTYNIILLLGLIVSLFSYLTILLKSDTIKNKIAWTFIVVIAIIVQRLTEPKLITESYKIFIRENYSHLTQLNDIVLKKTGDIFFIPNLDKQQKDIFSDTELKEIIQLTKELGISRIQKDTSKVFYETYGMLDVRIGVFYFYSDNNLKDRYKNITGSWYY